MEKFAELGNDEAIKVERLLRALEVFREEVDGALPASYMMAFLMVALNPGKGTGDYGKAMGVSQPVISRILLEIGPKSRTGQPGQGLVDSALNPTDYRYKQTYLTPKGRVLLRKLMNAMGKA